MDSLAATGTMGNYSGNSRFCQGPRRVFCFCLLAVITPALFVSIILLMRFVFNGSATYHINPSDMRILDHKISTTWCQSETIKMNTTFTAYLTDGEPRLVKAPAPLTTTKTLLIPDDHKEYWGFYLLKGSTFRIRTCASMQRKPVMNILLIFMTYLNQSASGNTQVVSSKCCTELISSEAVRKDLDTEKATTGIGSIGCILQALVGAGIPVLLLLGFLFHRWKKSRKENQYYHHHHHGWHGWHGWRRNMPAHLQELYFLQRLSRSFSGQ